MVEKFEPARKVISGKYKGKIAEPRWVVVGYFPTPAQALRFAYQHGIRDLANGDVPDLLAAVEASEDRVRRISHKIL